MHRHRDFGGIAVADGQRIDLFAAAQIQRPGDILDPTDFDRYLKGLRGTQAFTTMNQAYREKSGVQFMGIMVGVLLLGVFMPLWNLGDATLHPTKP